MERPTIAILLATYNGAQYLGELIDSLLRQSYPYFTVYIHDDGSTDGTVALEEDYAQKHENIQLLRYESQHGACANFLSMLERVEADYYLFCDHDDVWDEDKVRLSLEAMRQEEQKTPGRAVIVHTDLYVVDNTLQPIARSFLRYNGLHPEYLTTFDEAVIPFVTGCTMMMNAAARKAVRKPQKAVAMHDVWATYCVLSQGGTVRLIDQPLVFYRQHGTNTVGARDIRKVTLGYRMKHLVQILKNNQANYSMLRSLGYGSVLKYIRYKLRYKRRVLRNR